MLYSGTPHVAETRAKDAPAMQKSPRLFIQKCFPVRSISQVKWLTNRVAALALSIGIVFSIRFGYLISTKDFSPLGCGPLDDFGCGLVFADLFIFVLGPSPGLAAAFIFLPPRHRPWRSLPLLIMSALLGAELYNWAEYHLFAIDMNWLIAFGFDCIVASSPILAMALVISRSQRRVGTAQKVES